MTDEDVLDFWFDGDPTQWRRDRWFRADPAFDAAIADRFGFTHRAALDGALDGWAASPRGRLALVIVLDQFGRNLHRGSFLAFAGDAHARHIARDGLNAASALLPVQRVFLYLPFEHSEDPADQDLSVALYTALDPELGQPTTLASAHRHREVIARFGRFPHRNAALGRQTTPEELAFIAEPGSGF